MGSGTPPELVPCSAKPQLSSSAAAGSASRSNERASGDGSITNTPSSADGFQSRRPVDQDLWPRVLPLLSAFLPGARADGRCEITRQLAACVRSRALDPAISAAAVEAAEIWAEIRPADWAVGASVGDTWRDAGLGIPRAAATVRHPPPEPGAAMSLLCTAGLAPPIGITNAGALARNFFYFYFFYKIYFSLLHSHRKIQMIIDHHPHHHLTHEPTTPPPRASFFL
jgi:hypothetical protein